METDIEFDGTVDDEPEEEDVEDTGEMDGETDGELDDEDEEGGHSTTSISAMEAALFEPVLDILNKISSYYDELRRSA